MNITRFKTCSRRMSRKTITNLISVLSLLCICTIFCSVLPSFVQTDLLDSSGKSCFCQLEGQIDDCSCHIDTVDYYNNVKLYPRLNSLLNKNYFRFFKVNLKRPCPFWEDNGRCSLRDCSVKPCTEEQLPEGLKTGHRKQTYHNKYSKQAQNLKTEVDCEQELKLGHLDTAISDEIREDFVRWKEHDDAQDHFCEMEDETSVDMQHVDLLLNPERYTGYKGDSAWRIWKSIYEENCFKPHPGYGQYLDSNSVRGMCLEKRVFYRAVSGLHTSINIHLSARYLMEDKTGFGFTTWDRNVQEFQRRFDPELTNGEGPMRLRNLYFLYLLELRALGKAAPFLVNENFYTGNKDEDDEVRHAVSELLDVIKDFPEHFNESSMFTGDRKQADLLKVAIFDKQVSSDDSYRHGGKNHQTKPLFYSEEFRLHFVNISRIMDCVGCDKCRLWGKLQIQGLGTVLKILFSGEQSGAEFNLNAMKRSKFQLTRTEIVTLFNAFGRLSNSVFELEKFRKISKK